ncbi:MAG: dienelactone hydrolase family protein [Erythrobacter sp.]
MCDEAKLKQWARDAISRRQFGVLAGTAAVVACAPGEVTEAEENRAPEASPTAGALTDGVVRFDTADGQMDAFFVHPVKGAYPGVILWPDIASLRESKREMARRLAGEGYAVLVLNPYYRDRTGEQWPDFAAFIEDDGFEKVGPWREKHTADAIASDASAAVAWLDAQEAVDPKRGIGVQGYCMGGPLTVWSAAGVPNRIKAAASFHGGGLVREGDPLSPHRTLDRAEAAFLIAVAQDDDAEDPEAKEEFRKAALAAGRPVDVDVYAGDHGWTVLDSPAYAEAPAERAWNDLLELYGANL